MLKPQDIMILLKILSIMSLSGGYSKENLAQNRLAVILCISVSEVNAAMKRLTQARLMEIILKEDKMIALPNKPACEECLISGVKYFFNAQLGESTRGIPTSYAAPAFKGLIDVGKEPIPVWPCLEGPNAGVALEPLYRSVPKSLISYPDPLFYKLLALIDALRTGRAREREIAIKLLKDIMK